MKSFWENNGDPLPEGHKHAGEFAAVVDVEDGSAPSIYYGASHKEVADKLLVAQSNAATRIAQLRSQVMDTPADPAQPAADFQRRPLTADERMSVAHDITDPAKAPEAIRRVVESEVGASLQTVRERMSEDEEARRAQAAASEARAFADSTPDWWPTEYNKDVLRGYIETQGWGWTRKNFAKAFEALKQAGLVQFKPEPETDEPAPATEPTAPVAGMRQRGTIASTGLRANDATAAPGVRSPQKYTRAAVEAMSIAEYNHKLASDPEFQGFIRGLDAPAAASR